MVASIVRDTGRIAQCNNAFAINMRSQAIYNEPRRINGFEVSAPVETYFFKDQPFWWASRLYGRTPGVPTQSNNLFGYGRPRVSDNLTAVVEVNLPWRNLGRTKGAFLEDDETKSITLARRDGVTIHLSRSIYFFYMVNQKNFVSLSNGATLLRVCSVNSPDLADIREFVDIVAQAKAAAT